LPKQTTINQPREVLWNEPTPLEPHPRLAHHLGLSSLLVKRDDCNGLGFGGNKVRQLEYYLGEALSQSADTLLITGAVQSNFVRTAAAACAKLGLECLVQLENRVPNTEVNYQTSGNVLLDRLFGATIHRYPHGEDEEGADKQLNDLAEKMKAKGRAPYIVHLHPSHPPLGALGYIDCATELTQQLQDHSLKMPHIFVPSGSGNTHAGLLYGLRLHGDDTPVTGVCVRRDADSQRPRLMNRFEQIRELVGGENPVHVDDLELDDAFLAPGYGQANAEVLDAMKLAGKLGGLVLDPVYTAKTFAALIAYAKLTPCSDLIFIHTGGGPSIFGYTDVLSKN